jgi:RluA family pseudouridine synthase
MFDEEVKVENLKVKLRITDCAYNFLKSTPTKSAVKKAISRSELYLNNKLVSTASFVQNGDIIAFKKSEKFKLKPYKLEIEIVFEDDYLAIVNKPAGLSVSGNQFKTLENAIQWQLKASSQFDKLNNFRAAHRLDSPTSGLVIICKTKSCLSLMGEMFKNHQIQKKYIAIAMGKCDSEGVFDSKIDGKESITNYRLLKLTRSLKCDYLSLLELSPLSGRTHQIRKHLSGNGSPILGDTLYSENTIQKKGLFLFAKSLEFQHPITNQNLEIDLEIPTKFLKRMQREHKMWEKVNG